MPILDITSASQAMVTHFPISHELLSWIYIGATLLLVHMYFIQAWQYFTGKKGAGDFHFGAKLWQLAMRAVGLIYALNINDGSVFAVIMLDMIGRASEIVAAWRAHWQQRRLECAGQEAAATPLAG